MMKKNSNFYFGALAATALLAACATDDGLTDGNYDEQRGVVKTEFTISFPAKVAGGTRMTTETVQGQSTPVFRGIQDILLYPFLSKANGVTSSTTIPDNILLKKGTVGQPGPSDTGTDNKIAKSGALFAGNNSHFYKDIEIAINTQSFMFYGMAIPDGSNNFEHGSIIRNVNGSTFEDITFSLDKIRDDGTTSDNGNMIATYLSNIASAENWYNTPNVVLRTLFEKFITINGGSWNSVKGAVQQLYSELWNRTFKAEADNTVKGNILTAIKNATYAQDNDNDGTLTFEPLGNYPEDISLPDGAAYVTGAWKDANDHSKGYEFTVETTNSNMADVTALDKYVYPAPLYYRAKSNILTADESKYSVYSTASQWNDGTIGTGSDVLDAYGALSTGVNDIVKYTTRSIALVDQIQYAVGRLDATIKANSGTLKDYEDTDIALSRTVEATTVYNFPVTAILIGGQKDVDFEFHQKSNETNVYTIYDKVFDTTINLKESAPTETETTHTLVFETKAAEAADQADCVTKIAVEFLNNSGKLFVGEGGKIIYPDTKFYVVGTFDPYLNTTQHFTGKTGDENLIKQTFVQDYTTKANLIIKSLKHAYNTMPDLRAPQLELGLSVDMSWQNGITQTVNIE